MEPLFLIVAAEIIDEIMDKKEITFVLLASYWAKIKIENAHRSIAIASLMLSFQLRISVSIGDGSLKP